MADDLEEALSKIRPHVKSTLLNQSAPAKLLVAVESTLKEQNQELIPTAYYASLFTTLSESIKREDSSPNLEEGAVIPSTLYLLSIAFPYVSHTIIRSNVTSILTTLASLLPAASPSAPALRSILGVLGALVSALDSPHLTGPGSTPLLRQAFASVLELTIDQRPKVRKRAQEVVTAILSSPPPPLLAHPFMNQAAEFIVGTLEAVAGHPGQQESTEIGIWTCSYVKYLAPVWPSAHLEPLVQPLLALPSLSSSYLTTQAYGLISALLQAQSQSASSASLPVSSILKALETYAPNHHSLAAPWLDAIEQTMVAYGRADPSACCTPQVFVQVRDMVWPWLENDDSSCRIGAENTLVAMIRYCVTDSAIEDSIKEAEKEGDERKGKSKKPRSTVLGSTITQLSSSIHSVIYANAIPSLLTILTALISRLRSHTSTSSNTPVAQLLLSGLIEHVGALRLAKGFGYREKVDDVLGMAVRVMGPEALLELLPLNLIPEQSRGPGRAFLLPILASNTTNTRLAHFTSYFVPLSETLFNMKVQAHEAGKSTESKVWEVLIAQIWACFKGYCDLCTDLKEGFTTPFARLITNLLYTQPALRTSILQGLRQLVVTSQTLAQTSSSLEVDDSIDRRGFGITPAAAKESLTFLRSIASNMVSVLFNVFSSAGSEERGLAGEVISAWLGVLSEKDLVATYTRVTTMLQDALSQFKPSPTPSGTPVTHTMLDLLLLILPHVPVPSNTSRALFDKALSKDMMENKDAGVQKRTYRVMARLIQKGVLKGNEDAVAAIVARINETRKGVAQGAQKDRVDLLTCVIPTFSSSQLHLISSVLPEAILSTKDVSEKARSAAYDLLVAMGRRMQQGGIVKRSLLVDGSMDVEGSGPIASDVNANVEEYITMVAAGLVGSTPHMISATITALSRLLFEFQDVLPEKLQSELLATLIVFVGSANREVVKSVLGFIKVATIILPIPIIRPQLPDLVPALLSWSHDHKNHFKLKVMQIFERMARRFGWDELLRCADVAAKGDGGEKYKDGRAVLENLKKKKDRAKKKKTRETRERDEEDASNNETAPRPTTGDAFEDVLYGSDSDAESEGVNDDEDDPSSKKGGKSTQRPIAGRKGAKETAETPGRQKKQQKNKAETRIHADDDEPMDLLHAGAVTTISASGHKRRQPGQEASHFKADASGRMQINDSPASSDDDGGKDELAGAAYREQMTSVDGFTRTPNGQVKFHKNTKKRRAEEAAAEEGMDVDMVDGNISGSSVRQKKAKKEKMALGQEFKAKNAGGDIKKKGQQEPYAYLSLSQVGAGGKKQRGAASNYNITGKR